MVLVADTKYLRTRDTLGRVLNNAQQWREYKTMLIKIEETSDEDCLVTLECKTRHYREDIRPVLMDLLKEDFNILRASMDKGGSMVVELSSYPTTRVENPIDVEELDRTVDTFLNSGGYSYSFGIRTAKHHRPEYNFSSRLSEPDCPICSQQDQRTKATT